ncbi:hypothetical protein [Mucilaginibacter xinganensis]|uniref:Uncharacterized protein n=1 Tax=Mucilaginibacter xinganensis TaxID=1234841 RepID=A0A223P1T5_9SPHI|nr:hypothetical protein [Mucilaginibacter xinganensis]ASU36119.1 hypothetical protein MuYL_4234 [Mucilaginibacter xinganensis]
MITDEVFKRRRQHNNTPESILLIIANFIVVAAADTLFSNHHHLHWFFWVIIAGLVLYNILTIRKNYEAFDKTDKIAYAISIPVLILLVIVLQ